MTGLFDLSHHFADGMPGFTTTLPYGSRLRCTAGIRPLITYAESRGSFDGNALVGVDTWNVDGNKDAERPAHSWLLAHDIFIVRNPRNLAALDTAQFRFSPCRSRRGAPPPCRPAPSPR